MTWMDDARRIFAEALPTLPEVARSDKFEFRPYSDHCQWVRLPGVVSYLAASALHGVPLFWEWVVNEGTAQVVATPRLDVRGAEYEERSPGVGGCSAESLFLKAAGIIPLVVGVLQENVVSYIGAWAAEADAGVKIAITPDRNYESRVLDWRRKTAKLLVAEKYR